MEEKAMADRDVKNVMMEEKTVVGADAGISLIVSSTLDPASIGPARALLGLGQWMEGVSVEDLPTWRLGGVRLWQFNTKIIYEDMVDERWQRATGEKVMEVVFLSRHTAASARPAFTVHPIGVPHLCLDETPLAGGKPGKAPPPCPRVAAFFRLVMEIARARGFLPLFEVTLEATHHGPYLETPAMFLEIGSTEEYWEREDCAAVIAELCWRGFALGAESGDGGGDGGAAAVGEWSKVAKGTRVLVGIGGGHYAPRHVDMAKHEGVWVGHLVSGYSLPMELDDRDEKMNREELNGTGVRSAMEKKGGAVKSRECGGVEEGVMNFDLIKGRWREAIREVWRSTAIAFPGGELIANVDVKNFKSWQRQAILQFLSSEKMAVGKGKLENFLN